MGKHYESKYAMCCFYKGEDRGKGQRRIICEGFYKNSAIHMNFPSLTMLDEHRDRYCCSWNYENCPLAQSLSKIYEEDEEEEEKEDDDG